MSRMLATAEQVEEFERSVEVMRAAGLSVSVKHFRHPVRVSASVDAKVDHAEMSRLVDVARDASVMLYYTPSLGSMSLYLSRPPTAEELADEGLWR